MEKSYEIEFRALLSEEKYKSLLVFLKAQAEDLGSDDKCVWFFVMPEKLLKVTHNISKRSGKVTLKLTRIGQGSSFEEIEYPISENDIETAVKLFKELGHEYLLEPTILRHNYLYKGVELAVKFSKSWGYHMELEVLTTRKEDQFEAEQLIRSVADELGVKIMTDAELTDFTNNIEENYVHPTEATI